MKTAFVPYICRIRNVNTRSYLAIRSFSASKRQLDFVTSESVDKEQLTPALQQYFKFKEEYKGLTSFIRIIHRLCIVLSFGRLL